MLSKILLPLFILCEIMFSQSVDSLLYYEKQFNPALYDIKDLVFPHLLPTRSEETSLGFRVQVLVTNRLDSANSV